MVERYNTAFGEVQALDMAVRELYAKLDRTRNIERRAEIDLHAMRLQNMKRRLEDGELNEAKTALYAAVVAVDRAARAHLLTLS